MKHTLLIVEDDLDTSDMLRVYFEAQGYRVVTAGTGHDALDKCRTESPNLVLLDVRLPDIDGFEVGQVLQEDVRTSRLPVIFVTERRDRDDRIAGLKLGAIDYITKPFDVQELRLRVRNALRRAGSQNNPVTGLPGEKFTLDRLSLMMERDGWSAIGINISGLDTFNEIYGFVARDDVLRAIALTLTSAVDELGSIDDFIGHPAESQFIIITVPSKVDQLNHNVRERLKQAMTYFYPIHDREAGYVKRGEGDDAPKEKVPFMNLDMATLSQQGTAFSSVEALWQALSQPVRA
ncbi:MAG TPA: response regulator [Anaerolineae bacterium]|nr:response regulator [Anaerolineae bacterium]MCB0177489.1 response regulator [Anaerolineae bacterium]MCB0226515.1 response regulator [Anaerolineae bacterium]MCB9105338.1 response regulator [Anaerolineales bacterium]HRV91332.1 response regulator [Anaerolineae bacterium]